MQLAVSVRNAMLEAIEVAMNGQTLAAGTGTGGSITGTAAPPKVRFFNGSTPASCAAAETGTQLINDLACPADWMAAASAGVKSLAGTWSTTGATAAGAGTVATHYRIYDNAGTTCLEQGSIFSAVNLSTSAATAANGNVLTFTATTGVVAGMNVSGTGVAPGTTVLAVTGTTVTLSNSSAAGVAITTAITFNGDITLDNTSIASTQAVSITSKSFTAPHA